MIPVRRRPQPNGTSDVFLGMSTTATAISGVGRAQSLGEELANALSHGIGALAALGALPVLIAAAARAKSMPSWPYLVFGLSLVALLSASAIYHAAASPELKRRLRVLDHSSIYVLIAGTYTAYSVCYLGGAEGWVLFGLEWAIAAGGIFLSAYRIDKFRAAGPLIYLAMGWLIAPVFGRLRAALPSEAFALLVAGGAAYTLGIAFYAIKRVPYFHAVWHLFVLAGAACHLVSLLISARY
jgi:hemolysin III